MINKGRRPITPGQTYELVAQPVSCVYIISLQCFMQTLLEFSWKTNDLSTLGVTSFIYLFFIYCKAEITLMVK